MTDFRKQQGFGLVATLFVMVVITILSSSIYLTISQQNLSTARSIQSIRAELAAYSGFEYAASQLLTANSDNCNALPDAPISIEGFSVSLSCTEDPIIYGTPEKYKIYSIRSVATKGNYANNPDFILREFTGSISTGKDETP